MEWAQSLLNLLGDSQIRFGSRPFLSELNIRKASFVPQKTLDWKLMIYKF